MQFKFVTALAALATLPLSTLAISHEAFTSTNPCSSSVFRCTHNGYGGMPTGFYFSVLLEDLLEGMPGQGYSSAGVLSPLARIAWRRSSNLLKFKYAGDEGLGKGITALNGGDNVAQKIADLFEKKDFEALASYEEY